MSTNFKKMKKSLLILLSIFLLGSLSAQDLPKEVQKVFDKAEKHAKKKEYIEALAAYKEVLRSMEHVPSLIGAGDVQFYRKPPMYTSATEFYGRAIAALDAGIAGTDKKSVKKVMENKKAEIVPRFNKSKSHAKDFNKSKSLKQDGNRLLDDPDLKD